MKPTIFKWPLMILPLALFATTSFAATVCVKPETIDILKDGGLQFKAAAPSINFRVFHPEKTLPIITFANRYHEIIRVGGELQWNGQTNAVEMNVRSVEMGDTQCDTSPKSCGDGVVNMGEFCDDGNNDNADSCTNDCMEAFCGDGILGSNEGCDDGNSKNGDGCSFACAPEPPAQQPAVCGNGIVENGEQCDKGAANGQFWSNCSAQCAPKVPIFLKPSQIKLIKVCGNGIVETGEQCDKGAMNGQIWSNCSSHCTTKLPNFP